MKIVLIVVFILTACGLFLLLSGILKLPTLRTGRAMMQSGKKEKKLQKTLDAFYMDGAAYLGKYIGMNAYKKSRMQNVLNAAGLKMTPETYMAYAYLRAAEHFSPDPSGTACISAACHLARAFRSHGLL